MLPGVAAFGRRSILAALPAVALVPNGCAGTTALATDSKPAQGPQDDPAGRRTLSIDRTRCDHEGKRSDHEDLDHDGRADLIALYAGDGDDGVLACKQADLNFDGRLDAYFHYDDNGTLEREQFDLDFDGRIDVGRYYRDGLVVLDEQDTNHDGFVDAWRRYEKGHLVRIETDRDGDGKPDMLTYYVMDRIDRIGYDVDGDGRIDQWDHDAARRARLAAQYRKEAATPTSAATDEPEYVDEVQGDTKDPDSAAKQKATSAPTADEPAPGQSPAAPDSQAPVSPKSGPTQSGKTRPASAPSNAPVPDQGPAGAGQKPRDGGSVAHR